MTLTVETAIQAGQVATAINAVELLIADVQAAIATNGTIRHINVDIEGGQPPSLTSNLPLSLADTQSLLGYFITILQTNLAALNAELGAF